MKKMFIVLFFITVTTAQCSTKNPATTTSDSDSVNINSNQKSADTTVMRDSTVRRDSLR